MENNRIAKRVYVGEYAGSRSVGRPRKRCIDTVKNCLKKRGLDVSQKRTMVHARIIWRGFVRGMHGALPRRCYSCEMTQRYEALEGRKSVCGQAHNL